MWCQTVCGLFYENKTLNSNKSPRTVSCDETTTTTTNDEKMEVSKLQTDKQLDNEMNEENNASDSESSEEVNLNLNKKHNESKLLEQIVNRLKYRFKARIILQETINSLSKYFLGLYNS